MSLESLSETQRRLADLGFADDLVAEGDMLRSTSTGVTHDPGTLKAVEIVRFEGESDPDDEAVLVAVAKRNDVPLGTFTTPYGPAASPEQGDILRRLHRVIPTLEETDEHTGHNHVGAVFADRVSAEAAINDLREVGLGSDHMGAAIHDSGHIVFEHDEEQDLVDDVEVAIGSGAALGFLGGMTLLALAVPGIGSLGVAGLLALGGASGFGGAMVGAYVGIAEASEEFDGHQHARETKLTPGEVLVVACAHNHGALVKSAMQRHGGRLVALDA